MANHKMMITGATGFVGTHLIANVMANYGDEIEIIPFQDLDTGSKLDICDKSKVEHCIQSIQPDSVIHLAAIAAPKEARQDPSKAWAVNFHGTFTIAQAILAHSPHCRLIWSGSAEEYGQSFNINADPILETAPLVPLTTYGATKAACDIMLHQMAQDGLQSILFRPFNHTGPGQNPDYVVAAFASQIAKIEKGLQEPVLKVGNLEAKRDFLDVRDVVKAYIAAALAPKIKPGKQYNLSTGNPVQIRELLDLLIGFSDHPIKIEIDSDRYAPNTVEQASGNYDAAHTDFGWSIDIPLEQTLKDVLDDFRNQTS